MSDDAEDEVIEEDLLTAGKLVDYLPDFQSVLGSSDPDLMREFRSGLNYLEYVRIMNEKMELKDINAIRKLEGIWARIMRETSSEAWMKSRYGPTNIPVVKRVKFDQNLVDGNIRFRRAPVVVPWEEEWHLEMLATMLTFLRYIADPLAVYNVDFRIQPNTRQSYELWNKILDHYKKLGNLKVISFYSLFNELILHAWTPNKTLTRKSHPKLIIEDESFFEYFDSFMSVKEPVKVEPLSEITALKMMKKDSAAGGMLKGNKSGWYFYLYWLYYNDRELYDELKERYKVHRFTHRNEKWGKQRAIDMNNPFQSVEWTKYGHPLMALLKRSNIFYGKPPAELNMLIKTWMDEGLNYTLSVDFENYGPIHSFDTWEIGATLASRYITEPEGWMKVFWDMRRYQVLLPSYALASSTIETKNTSHMGTFVKSPNYSMVTGAWPHNITGTFTSAAFIAYIAYRLRISTNNVRFTGMVDDMIVWFRYKSDREAFINKMPEVAELFGLKVNMKKQETGDGIAYLMKSVFTTSGFMHKPVTRIVGNTIRSEPLSKASNRFLWVCGAIDKWIESPRYAWRIFKSMARCADDNMHPGQAYRNLSDKEREALHKQIDDVYDMIDRYVERRNYLLTREVDDSKWRVTAEQALGLLENGWLNINPFSVMKWDRRIIEISGQNRSWHEKSFDNYTDQNEYMSLFKPVWTSDVETYVRADGSVGLKYIQKKETDWEQYLSHVHSILNYYL